MEGGTYLGHTHFILRDLTFVVSGAMVITAVGLYPPDMFKFSFGGNEKLNWFLFPAFLVSSYVLGVLLQEAARIFLERASKWYISFREWWANRGKSEMARTQKVSTLNDELVVNIEKLV